MKKKLTTISLIIILLISCSFYYSNLTSTLAQSTPQINYYFSQYQNQHLDLELIKLINSSKKTLDIAIYSITKDNIVNAIILAEKRGVKVRLIIDKTESSIKSESKELVLLNEAKIPMKVDGHKGLMHLKLSIIDNSIVTTGSYNYSKSATDDNDEVLVVIKDNKVTSDFESEFSRMWNDTEKFSDY